MNDRAPAGRGGVDVRFEWGPAGIAAVDGGVVVIVDVLRFTSTVEAATRRGVLVYPYGWRDETSVELAASVGARLGHGTDPDRPSLSPLSYSRLVAGDRVVLASPNGGACTLLAADRGTLVVAACLRNAAAVGEWIRARHDVVSVIACGERWPDGTLRPALEDLLGAGTVLAALGGNQSPEARAAVAAWTDAHDHIEASLSACVSGQELISRGCHDDVVYAAAANVSTVVPILVDGRFTDAQR